MDKSVITRVVTVAGGPFAPGHLGELTQQVPFEMVDAALEQTCRVQRRVRDLPAGVVVYLLLAGCLFSELGYPQVWRKLTAGLEGLPFAVPTASAVTQARRRLGPGRCARCPACCAARPRQTRAGAGCWSARSTGRSCPSPTARRTWPSTQQRGGPNGGSGYPQLRLLALVSCGTRTVIDAVFASCPRRDHLHAALLPSLHAGMLLLADRNFAAASCREDRGDEGGFPDPRPHRERRPKLPVLCRLPDGSWLSRFGGVTVRVIDAEITVTTSAGGPPTTAG